MQQSLRFSSTDFPSPQDAFARLRGVTADMCETTAIGEIADFRIDSTTIHLGSGVLLDVRSTALRYDRTPSHIARGADAFQLTIYRAGGVEFFAADRAYLQRAGDVCLIDMGQPNEARVMTASDGLAHGISFLLPRMVMAPLYPTAEAIPPIAIVPRETTYGRLLGDYMFGLHDAAANLSQAEHQGALHALAHLAAAGAGQNTESGGFAGLSQDALRARIRHHIEDNLGQVALTVEALCRRFELSRASLYRLFAPQSPATYIQERRLHRAHAMLISPAFRSWRLLDIAVECCFSSDATLIRAFRRQFGITPGEAREFANHKPSTARPGRKAPLFEPDAEAMRWLMQLTGAMPPPTSRL